jgi:ribonuclease HII
MTRRRPAETVAALRARYLAGAGPVTAAALAAIRRDRRAGVQQLYAALKRRLDQEESERARIETMLRFEQPLWHSGVTDVAGVDEVGMGPLAGPVVAAAVVFAAGTTLAGVDDSKRLDPARRETLASEIRARAVGIGIGISGTDEIDQLNVYHAGLQAMRRAVEALPRKPQHLLVDARTIPGVDVPQDAYPRGDALCFSIAAASILAKTHRDRMMLELDAVHPGYGFAVHKGYDTPEHRAALERLGPCAAHRMSYAAIGEICGACSPLFYALRARLDSAGDAATLATLGEEVRARRAELAGSEARKLALLVARRRKALG